jgi:hypothetical protein
MKADRSERRVSSARSLGTKTSRHPTRPRDRAETVTETADLKSLARRVLARDTVRDTTRDPVSRGGIAGGEKARQGPPETCGGVPAPYASYLAMLQVRCPDLIEEHCYQLALRDCCRFLDEWGEQAHALGWSAQDLLGLHPVPEKPRPNYRRLSRYDQTGLIWLLQGRRVAALTEDTAAIENASGAISVYRRYNKPAFGPLGDSLDDLE